MTRSTLLITLLTALLLTPLHAHAQPQAPAGTPPAAPGAAATATVTVQVVRTDGAPVAEQDVVLEWRDSATRVVNGSWRARTDAEGRAVFTGVDATRDPHRFILRARVDEGAVSHPSPPIMLSQGQGTGTITTTPITLEASELAMSSMITILEVPAMVGDRPNFEGLIAIQQVIELKTPPGTAFNGRGGNGLTIPLPNGALGAQGQVVQGSGAVVSGDGQLTYRGVIHPLDNGGRAQMVLFYFLRASGSKLVFDQTLPIAGDNVRVAFIRDTDLPAFPRLDVTFAPGHAFTQVTEAADVPMLKGRSVLAGIHPKLEPGGALRFTVEGLPFGGASGGPAAAGGGGGSRGGSAGPVASGSAPPRDAIHGGGGGGAQGEPKPIRLTPRDIEKTVTARIRVQRQTAPKLDAGFAPQGGAKVGLRWFNAQGAPVEEIYEGTSDAEGWAVVENVPKVRSALGFTLRGFVVEGGVRHPSERIGYDAGTETFTGDVKMTQVTGDPAAVVGGSLITILQVPDQMQEHPDFHDFVTVQQIVELTTSTWSIYDTRSAVNPEHANGVAYTVPIKAEGVQAQVMGGMGEVKIQDSTISYRGLIFPPGDDFPRVRLQVSFLMKPNGSELEYEQPMSLPFADVRAVFLRDTKLKDHPVLDVNFVDSPFQTITDDAEDGIMQGRRVRIARDPAQPIMRGSTLSFRVTGLPYPEDRIPYVALVIVFLMAIGGVFLGVREVRKARERRDLMDRGAPEVVAELDEQIDTLYKGLTLLERDYEDGEVSESEYVAEQARLKTRITLLVQRREGLVSEKQPTEEGSAA